MPQSESVAGVLAFGDYSFAFEEYKEAVTGMNGWAIAAIVISVLLVVAGGLFAVYWFLFRGKNITFGDIFKKNSYSKIKASLITEAADW